VTSAVICELVNESSFPARSLLECRSKGARGSMCSTDGYWHHLPEPTFTRCCQRREQDSTSAGVKLWVKAQVKAL